MQKSEKGWKSKRKKERFFSVEFLPNFIFQKIYCEDFDGFLCEKNEKMAEGKLRAIR